MNLPQLRAWCEDRLDETDDLERIGSAEFYKGRHAAYQALVHNLKRAEDRIQREEAGERVDPSDQFSFLKAEK